MLAHKVQAVELRVALRFKHQLSVASVLQPHAGQGRKGELAVQRIIVTRQGGFGVENFPVQHDSVLRSKERPQRLEKLDWPDHTQRVANDQIQPPLPGRSCQRLGGPRVSEIGLQALRRKSACGR